MTFTARPSRQLFELPPDYTQVGSGERRGQLSVQELEAKAGFAVRQPRHLPAGYVLLGGAYRDEEKSKERQRAGGRTWGLRRCCCTRTACGC